ARRVQAALAPYCAQARVTVRHMESLHPHDAVAQAGKLA
ncbi:MAG: GTP cyclohydrolase I FolE2, partial [Janthinobacterium sp.]